MTRWVLSPIRKGASIVFVRFRRGHQTGEHQQGELLEPMFTALGYIRTLAFTGHDRLFLCVMPRRITSAKLGAPSPANSNRTTRSGKRAIREGLNVLDQTLLVNAANFRGGPQRPAY